MKCVRCGKNTSSKTSFCKDCRDFLNNRDEYSINDGDDESSVNWGYMMVSLSVVAVAAMIAFIVYCTK